MQTLSTVCARACACSFPRAITIGKSKIEEWRRKVLKEQRWGGGASKKILEQKMKRKADERKGGDEIKMKR